MTKGRRERLLEIHKQATNDINRALNNIMMLIETYAELKPDMTAELDLYAQGLIEWQAAFKRFKEDRM